MLQYMLNQVSKMQIESFQGNKHRVKLLLLLLYYYNTFVCIYIAGFRLMIEELTVGGAGGVI